MANPEEAQAIPALPATVQLLRAGGERLDRIG